MNERRYQDRAEAGRALAQELTSIPTENTVVYGLARGGVPVAAVVASELGCPLDALLVRKIGAPGNPELALGAITSYGGMTVNERVASGMNVSRDEIDRLAQKEREEAKTQERSIRGDNPAVSPEGRTVILVDDGLATGASMAAAVQAMREAAAARIIVAVPVASSQARDRVARLADEVHCLSTPASFSAVGQWYADFGQVSNDAVRRLIQSHPNG
ncbi:MAG TPA: phosphoribosyltransferase family protein [Spirochaetia bacterium]|nr:phosphoribosyltransferase family protein [Spirochaetia bacterium]